MPNNFNTYYEPFIGGGAMFFDLKPKKAVISDYNEELINSYLAFKNKELYKMMIEALKNHEKEHSEDYYYEIRNLDRKANFNEFSNPQKAARLIYLNKACFNGIYRVNSSGHFNVPSGKKEKVKAYQPKLFSELHKYLLNPNIKILSGDFAEVVKTAKEGDFIYFDPPYDSFEEQATFTA